MRFLGLFSFYLLFVVFTPLSPAAPISSLYEGVVPIVERSDEAYAQAVRQALSQVLLKLTGMPKVLQSVALQKQLSQAPELVEQYEYRDQPAFPGDTILESLVVRFSPEPVNRLLINAGIPIWRKDQRPLVLLLVAIQTPEIQAFVNEEEARDSWQILNAQAKYRGLPVLFPLFDLDDLANLPAIKANESSAILQASARYAPGAILAGIAAKPSAASEWEGNWRLYQDKTELSNWRSQKSSLSEVLQEAINRATETLATRFITPTAAESGTVELLVQGISKPQDYFRLQTYLSSLDTVKNLAIQQVEPTQIRFRIEVSGGRASLEQALSLERVLIPITIPPPNSKGILVYRLQTF